MSAILQARSVDVSVRNARLLDAIDLDVAGGETVAIIGPNGAGKSTLLRSLSSDIKPTSGTIELAGRDIRTYPAGDLALRRAMLSQHIAVSFPFTVREIVRMGGGDQPRAMIETMIDAALDGVGITHLQHRELPTLSGGEQQRAHFARVLVQLTTGEQLRGPGLLLLDEPTSSLDMNHQIALVETARQRASQGTAVVAVLHDLNLAVRFAERIVVLKSGMIVAEGTPEQTITSQILRDVFDIDVAILRAADGSPYILPQHMQRISDY